MSSDRTRGPRAIGNPVRAVAARTRLRGALGPAVLVGWLVGLGGTAVASWVHVVGTDQLSRQPSIAPGEIGRALGQWWVLAVSAGMLVALPAVTAGALAGARQRHTATPWKVSLVPARSIVWGHTLTGWAFALLLAVTAIPYAALAWALGGIGPAELGAGLAAGTAVGMVATCVTLAVSSLTRRTATALLLTYLLLALLVVGSAMVHASGDPAGGGRPVDAVLLANPLVGAADAATSARAHSGSTGSDEGRRIGATEAPTTHLAALVHRGHRAAGPASAAWPTTAAGGLAVGLLSLLIAAVGTRRRRVG